MFGLFSKKSKASKPKHKCNRCGRNIIHLHKYKGEVYGSECIRAVKYPKAWAKEQEKKRQDQLKAEKRRNRPFILRVILG